MNQNFVPRAAVLTKGVGHDGHPLAAFDAALRDAGVSGQNLVPVSSVFPPGCRLVSRDEGIGLLTPGQITFCVMARADSSVAGTRIASAIGLVISADPNQYGYLAEHHSEGQSEAEAKRFAASLARQLLGAKLGVDPGTVPIGREESVAAATTVRSGWASTVSLCVLLL